MSKVFAAIYVTAVLALTVTALLIWRLRCESFGCMGVGIAWIAWAVTFFPVLAIGIVLRSRQTLGVRVLQITRAALWAQVGIGAVLLVAWVCKNVI
jgi:energy-converting hydrogenase Eha subunit A